MRTKAHTWIKIGKATHKCVTCDIVKQQFYKKDHKNKQVTKFFMNGVEQENKGCKI